ncbi:hypothetical protein [Kordiimonas aestuarii]|uniref:hypothetical protein n=1 Tax=Kordiimonas aestuarii TaxID=1005925 RepID=UPI0021D0ED0D|nr:hypothetical protein [Kordiimonas aestuarii]
MTKTAHYFPLLKYALLADAVASAVTGLLLVFGAKALTSLLGLPADLLFYCGLFFLPWALLVAFVGTRQYIKAGAVWPIAILNLLWVADSFVLLASIDPAPTALGTAFVTFQAVAVLAFAIGQIIGVKRQKTDASFQAA